MADKKTPAKKAVTKKDKSENAKYSELIKMSLKELNSKVNATKKDLEVLKYNTRLGDVQNVRAYKYKRRYLAKLLTAFNSKKQLEEDK